MASIEPDKSSIQPSMESQDRAMGEPSQELSHSNSQVAPCTANQDPYEKDGDNTYTIQIAGDYNDDDEEYVSTACINIEEEAGDEPGPEPQAEPEMEDFERELKSLLQETWEQTPVHIRRKGQLSEKKIKKNIDFLKCLRGSLLSPKNLEGYKDAIVEIMEINNEEEISSAQQKADYEDEMSQKLSRSVNIFKSLDHELDRDKKAIASNESLRKQHKNLETLVSFLESKESRVKEAAKNFKELVHDISTLNASDTQASQS